VCATANKDCHAVAVNVSLPCLSEYQRGLSPQGAVTDQAVLGDLIACLAPRRPSAGQRPFACNA
jgi:hypothetical protein